MSGTRSLQQMAEGRLLGQLTDAVTGYQATANFSCGGSVPIDIRSTTRYGDFTSTRTPITSPPVIIRWDAPSGDVSGKITFPVPPGKEPVLEQLVKDCQPATFGYGGENILDDNIRSAGKLEASEFSTSFNPYDYGIVDAVAQALLPGIARPELTGENTNEQHWGVVAELYKLNVYSAPADKFKPHVDTPRGFTQFGSLVVCLPNPHDGGQLRVAHKGVERTFDLGSKVSSGCSIQWAAFYSDCEHEVLPVTSGHRVTLTYQLYVSEHLGGAVNPQFPTIDPRTYPLYQSVKELLESPAFMKDGGTLGFHCAHQYAHTDGTANERLPHALKGIDVVLFTIFRALGLTVHVRPVLEDEMSEYDDSDEEHETTPSAVITRAAQEFRPLMIDSREMGGMSQAEVRAQNRPQTFELRSVNFGDGMKTEIAGQIRDFWGGYEMFVNVRWLNERLDHEIAIAYQQWLGNETETGWSYSHVALLVVVPPFSERKMEGK